MERGWYCQLCAGSGVTTQPCGNAATVVVVVVVEVAVEAQQYAYKGTMQALYDVTTDLVDRHRTVELQSIASRLHINAAIGAVSPT